MGRFKDFTQQKIRQIRIQNFYQYFRTCENLLVQILWPQILKFSPAFSVNAGLISDPGVTHVKMPHCWKSHVRARIKPERRFHPCRKGFVCLC